MSLSSPHPDNAHLYFWAFGDLHYSSFLGWQAAHNRRFAAMFTDLHELWSEIGTPTFCVSPGDLVETCAQADYQLARESLAQELGDIPFYPGIGNHEYHAPHGEDPQRMASLFTQCWNKPLRYTWGVGGLIHIMLDFPNLHLQESMEHVYITQETLNFLDTALSEHAEQRALIFLHCPPRNTVLDRDPKRHRDFHSLQPFFSPENSQELRDILARHANACLFFSGHTHSGWEAPNLLVTEQLGGHAVTFVNLMSPWYTGHGPGHYSGSYIADDPDIIPTFCVRIYSDRASIRVRDHQGRRWLKEWTIPMQ